jgi:hypothetical protein
MSEPKIINVVYEFIDGAHIFSSTDPLACGLYAASVDLKDAYEDVPTQLKTLLKLNHEIDDDVKHELPFDQFVKQLLSALTRALETRHRGIGRDRVRGVFPPNAAIALRMEMRVA